MRAMLSGESMARASSAVAWGRSRRARAKERQNFSEEAICSTAGDRGWQSASSRVEFAEAGVVSSRMNRRGRILMRRDSFRAPVGSRWMGFSLGPVEGENLTFGPTFLLER